jgi:hypothetical protein
MTSKDESKSQRPDPVVEQPIWLGYDRKAHAMIGADLALVGSLLVIGGADDGRRNFMHATLVDLLSSPAVPFMQFLGLGTPGHDLAATSGLFPIYSDDDVVAGVDWLAAEAKRNRATIAPTGLVSFIDWNKVVPGDRQIHPICLFTGPLGETVKRLPILLDGLLEIASGSEAGVHLVAAASPSEELPGDLLRAFRGRVAFGPMTGSIAGRFLLGDGISDLGDGEVLVRLPGKPPMRLARVPIPQERVESAINYWSGDRSPQLGGTSDDTAWRRDYESSVRKLNSISHGARTQSSFAGPVLAFLIGRQIGRG